MRAADRIFDTARELFYREGTRAVGVDEIVSRAGATKPTLYRSFESKDQLIAAYLRYEGDHFWDYFDAAAEAHPGDPKAQILAYLDGLAARADRPGYRGCGLTNAAVEYPDPQHPGRQVAVEHKQELRERLRAMARVIDARKPDELADALLLLIEGVFVSSQLFGPGGPATAVRPAAEALFDAYAPGRDD
ncbi:helix-turn-helix domain-containing protein [Phenylobacterium sp.]|uniref:TetR/AcrR family transcriptional regulator n=1 Tax=Phenylobacterium sp. TaxID=1871053 RepID=UPI002811A58E|nr:helix-turn-helix domain-containing protein [Phenylobacterium sp.]